MTAGSQSITAKLTGIPALIAYASVVRIQKSSMAIEERTNLAVSTYSWVRAMFKDKKEFSERITELGVDLKALREQYEKRLDSDEWSIEDRNEFNHILDGIEFRITDLIVDTHVLDGAGLREMAV